jgi:predicted urease superfamily metal-dependent hydrolase
VSGITVDEVTKRVENTVYTAVGLGILGFQHLQVQRRELRRTLDAVLRQVADAAGRTAGDR